MIRTQVGADIVWLESLADEVESEMSEDDADLRDEDVISFARDIVEEMDGECSDEDLADTLRGIEDGGGLIHESYFEDYARQTAEDIGAIQSDAGWPATCIDWEQAARELQMDYTSVETGAGTYYYLA